MLMKCLRVRQFAGWELHRGCQLVLVTHDTGSDNRVKLERKHRAQGYPSSQLCPLQSIESCKNPKGRLGVLTVWEESNVPAVAHSLQAREGYMAPQGSHRVVSPPHEPNLQTSGHPGQTICGCLYYGLDRALHQLSSNS